MLVERRVSKVVQADKRLGASRRLLTWEQQTSETPTSGEEVRGLTPAELLRGSSVGAGMELWAFHNGKGANRPNWIDPNS